MMKKTIEKILWTVALISCCLCFLLGAGKLWNYQKTKNEMIKNVDIFKEVYYQKNNYTGTENEDEPIEEIDPFEKIKELNEDYLTWIKIDGTNIDYPVLSAPYGAYERLRYGYFDEYNIYGTIFLDPYSSLDSRNILVRGHNTFNDHEMFSDLSLLLNQDFLNEHKTVQFNDRDWNILCAFTTTRGEEEYSFTDIKKQNFENDIEFDTWLSHHLNKAGVTVQELPKQVLVLQTCLDFDDGMIIVIAS